MNLKQTLLFTLQLTAGHSSVAMLHPASMSPHLAFVVSVFLF